MSEFDTHILHFRTQSQRSFHCGSVFMNPASLHEDAVLILGLTQWVKDPDLLWHRPAPAALIQYLAWELRYATNAALKSKIKKTQSQSIYFLCLRLYIQSRPNSQATSQILKHSVLKLLQDFQVSTSHPSPLTFTSPFSLYSFLLFSLLFWFYYFYKISTIHYSILEFSPTCWRDCWQSSISILPFSLSDGIHNIQLHKYPLNNKN